MPQRARGMCQIGEEATRVAQRAAVAADAQDSQANKDNVLTAATIVIFAQRRFFIGGRPGSRPVVCRAAHSVLSFRILSNWSLTGRIGMIG